MSQLHYLTSRCFQRRNTLLKTHARTIIQRVLLSSSNSDDEQKAQRKLEQKKRSQDALNKLNDLLKTMIEEDVSSKTKLDLAKPTDKRKKGRDRKEEIESTKLESPEKPILSVVKDVAESIGGNVKETESELLTKLLNSTSEDKSASLSDIIKGMKIDQKGAVGDQSRAEQVRQILEQVERRRDPQKPRIRPTPKPIMATEKIDLFGSEPLGIFTDQSATTEGVQNKTWSKLYERDMKLAVTHPPSNYFQQMILWTEQGKVWKFPIDNEQGLEEEQKIYFTEHVFLEKHLEPWCPQKGPLRHFMELVCVGLSKNPYLTVEAKKEHIEWFKNYFENKKQLLKEVGALQELDVGNINKPKQIE